MKKYNGLYKATIVAIDDDKKMNRVQIRVKGLMDGIPADYLPWARYQSPSDSGHSSYQPVKDSKVWVRFADGDINYPYYVGGVVESADDLPINMQENRTILYESDGGIVITVNDDIGDIEIKTQTYNTTLGTIIDKFLSHTHLGNLGYDTSPPPLAINATLPTAFQMGSLK